MRHRISDAHTGLGNSEPCILTNNFKFNRLKCYKKFGDDAIKTFRVLNQFEGFDFFIQDGVLIIGIEPAYIEEELQLIYINLEDKNRCALQTGIARGYYGSRVQKRIKYYNEYKISCPFKNFIDRWYDKLVEEIYVKSRKTRRNLQKVK